MREARYDEGWGCELAVDLGITAEPDCPVELLHRACLKTYRGAVLRFVSKHRRDAGAAVLGSVLCRRLG